MPLCNDDQRVLISEFWAIADSGLPPHYSDLIRCLLTKDVLDKFTVWPASTKHHHYYKFGLLEHTVGVARLVRRVSGSGEFKDIDRSVVLTAALIHDLGKTNDYKIDSWNSQGGIQRTEEGRLFGHIMWLEAQLSALMHRWDSEHNKFASGVDWTSLAHCLLAHHGRLEWGSPVVPQTREALLLHLCDMLDSQANKMGG